MEYLSFAHAKHKSYPETWALDSTLQWNTSSVVTFLPQSSQNIPVEYVVGYFCFKLDTLIDDNEFCDLHLSQDNITFDKSIFSISMSQSKGSIYYHHKPE